MAKFKFRVNIDYTGYITVEADNEDEAYEKMDAMYDDIEVEDLKDVQSDLDFRIVRDVGGYKNKYTFK